MSNRDRIDVAVQSPASPVDLPPPNTKHWDIKRKAMVVTAARIGDLSLQEACRRYSLSDEEFLAWERSFNRYGVPGSQGDLPANLPFDRYAAC